MSKQPNFMQLVESLFRHGLSELPVLHTRANGTYLGYMVYEKGHLAFKDSGLFSSSRQIDTDWEQYSIGMVCYREMLQWKSLSFYGLDYCEIGDEVNPELMSSLTEVRNEFGDRLFDFVGSIYRAYKLLLANDFLPVVLLRQTTSKNNHPGLVIGDLRASALPPELMAEVRELILQTLYIRLTVGLDEIAA